MTIFHFKPFKRLHVVALGCGFATLASSSVALTTVPSALVFSDVAALQSPHSGEEGGVLFGQRDAATSADFEVICAENDLCIWEKN